MIDAIPGNQNRSQAVVLWRSPKAPPLLTEPTGALGPGDALAGARFHVDCIDTRPPPAPLAGSRALG
jgi:hypothetical protein